MRRGRASRDRALSATTMRAVRVHKGRFAICYRRARFILFPRALIPARLDRVTVASIDPTSCSTSQLSPRVTSAVWSDRRTIPTGLTEAIRPMNGFQVIILDRQNKFLRSGNQPTGCNRTTARRRAGACCACHGTAKRPPAAEDLMLKQPIREAVQSAIVQECFIFRSGGGRSGQ